jgi:diguanylate cyclase (GGDEF)-like protein
VARERLVIAAADLVAALNERGLDPPADLSGETDRSGFIGALPAAHRVAGVLRLGKRVHKGAAVDVLEGVCAFLGNAIDHAVRFERARTEARVDALTGLQNYRGAIESLQHEIQRVERFGKKLALLLVDLDGFKEINDRCGHAAGDALLRHAASRIRAVLRQVDVAARLGGDEFVVLLPETDLAGARFVGDRVLAALRDSPAVFRDRPLPITASVGIAEWRAGLDAEALLCAADQAMYAAKRLGRDCVCSDT